MEHNKIIFTYNIHMIPKKWEVWRTIRYLSDDSSDRTQLVDIIELVNIGWTEIVRYRENISIWTHILLSLCTWWVWLLMYYWDSNLSEKRLEEFLKISSLFLKK